MGIKSWIREWFFRWGIGAIKYRTHEINKLSAGERVAFLAEVKILSHSEALKREIDRIKEEAEKTIIRHTNVGTEIAYNRGVILGLEALEKRLKYIATLK